ncbi:MAG: ribonuclease PH [Pseudomonadota bacterium]
MRTSNRDDLGLRRITLEPNFIKHAEGSCLLKMGETWVITTASVEEKVPPWLERKGSGWVTAEYAMLPRATNSRTRREGAAGKQTGRTQEIQRLIGRALRAAVDLKALGERTITIDCDVIQADGGTRIASINGGFVSLALAIAWLQKKEKIATSPIKSAVAGISLGLKKGNFLVDPDYNEDSTCDVDLNVVMLEKGKIVELQGTAEGATFTAEESNQMVRQASHAIERIFDAQYSALGVARA